MIKYEYEWQPDLELAITELLTQGDEKQEETELAVFNAIAQEVESDNNYYERKK